jgi:hypothetical protein
MIDALRLAAGWGLVWLCGVGIVALIAHDATARRPGAAAWAIGCGYFAGAFAVTVWMRVLSFAGIRFSVASIGLPLALATLALGFIAWRRNRPSLAHLAQMPAAGWRALSRGERVVVAGLAAWLGVRFVVLLLDVVWTPLYPWDAWIQWATKARVWYALGEIVPFGRSEAWFAANGAIWFDASPNYPATIPLWQVWSSVALGRWDDALMNLPWWLTAVALAIAIHGALRESGIGSPGALAGAWLVSSLPLGNVHVALAGYADLPMAGYYALAAISVWRWSQRRTPGSAALAIRLPLPCLTINSPGKATAATLLPGVVMALAPRSGPRIVAAGLAAVLVILVVLAQTQPVVLGYRLHLDFGPAWEALLDSLFLLGNWHLLWYAVIAGAILAFRDLRAPRLASLSVIVGSGLLFLAIAFSFTNARNWVTDQTTINRALLHMAPLALAWTLLIVHAWFVRTRAPVEARAPEPAAKPA